jgi:hypothetical protein
MIPSAAPRCRESSTGRSGWEPVYSSSAAFESSLPGFRIIREERRDGVAITPVVLEGPQRLRPEISSGDHRFCWTYALSAFQTVGRRQSFIKR